MRKSKEYSLSELHVIARFQVQDGKLEEFKGLAQECVEIVRQKEKGALRYARILNEYHTGCGVREKYTSSAALLEHVTNVGVTLGKLMTVADLAIEVYGSPSEELLNATAGLGIAVHGFFQGK